MPDGLSASTVLVSRYDAVWQDAGTHNRFELDRAELGVAYRFGVLSGVFRVESIRSAGPDSYLGIDKNSLLPRVRFAYAEVAPAWEFIEARLRTGVVPEPWVETLESGYDVRGLAPLASQRGAFFPPADLGLRLDLSFLGGLATLRLAALNGEGHSQIDLNGGKNLTGILSLATPALELWGPWRVSLHGGFRDGSTGIGAIRNHRAMAALVLDHPWLQAGAEYAHAFGHRARGELEASSLGLWARGAFWLPALGYALRYERIDEDQRLAETERETVTGALWFEWRPSLWAPPGRPRSPAAVPATDRVRFYLGAEEQRAGAAVGPVPGMPDALNHRRIFFVAELVADFFGRAASPSLSFPANPPGATLPRKEDPS